MSVIPERSAKFPVWQGPRTYATLDCGGPVAQRLEQQTHNLLVVGSNPTGPTKNRRAASFRCRSRPCLMSFTFGHHLTQHQGRCHSTGDAIIDKPAVAVHEQASK
jgi:hypothetical protein